MNDNSDWVAEFHRTNAWQALADWLVRHDTYLARSMASFAAEMATGTPDTDSGQPTARQIALLVSLRGGVEALMRLDDMQQAAPAEAPSRPLCGAYSKTTGKPCANPVIRAGDKCGVHRARLAADTYAEADAPGAVRCSWRGKSGRRKPCRAYVQHGTDRCWHHQPDVLARDEDYRRRLDAMHRAAGHAATFSHDDAGERTVPPAHGRVLH